MDFSVVSLEDVGRWRDEANVVEAGREALAERAGAWMCGGAVEEVDGDCDEEASVDVGGDLDGVIFAY